MLAGRMCALPATREACLSIPFVLQLEYSTNRAVRAYHIAQWSCQEKRGEEGKRGRGEALCEDLNNATKN